MFNTHTTANNTTPLPPADNFASVEVAMDLEGLETLINTVRQRMAEAEMRQTANNDLLVANETGFGFHWEQVEEGYEGKEEVQKLAAQLSGLEALHTRVKTQIRPTGSGLSPAISVPKALKALEPIAF